MATTQGIKLDDGTSSRLKELAKKRDRSPHWLMRTAIETYLEREEKYERDKDEDMDRWDNYLTTGKAIEQPQVEVWLNDLAHNKRAEWPK